MKPSRAVASFDSATAMLRVLSRHLAGRSSPGLGLGPAARAMARPVLPGINHLPAAAREKIYTYSGASEAVPQRLLGDIDAEDIAEWVVGHYPRRRYSAVLVGSSSGAAIHLAALLGVPWLPQTLLVPVRQRHVDPDEPQSAVHALAAAREDFCTANPQVGLHHMHDANQDRLMIRRMAYFRFKYRELPRAYVDFLRECLAPGATVLVTDCAQRWPTTGTGTREMFQHGAVGGATPEEYLSGGPRVARFLAAQGSSRRAWQSPEPDSSSPEAEWGFDPALLPGLERVAAEQQWQLEHLRFDHPDLLSAPVARLYRSWYAAHDVDPDRLVVGCFALFDPHLPLQRGRVPYWTTFGTRPARDKLLDYLGADAPFDEIDLGLFSHGTNSIGLAGTGEWDEVLHRARRRGAYCGIDRARFPQDFASNLRFYDELSRREGGPAPHPAPWTWVRERMREMRDAGVSFDVSDRG